MKERHGKVKAKHIDKTNARTLEGEIVGNIGTGSTLYTDDFPAYNRIEKAGYAHHVVKHSAREYVNGMAHTNGIESFWALLKRGFHGTHHSMSAKHLDRYVIEFAGRYNNRGASTLNQMEGIAKGLDGSQLRYRDLIS